jgi:hypothetical protein
MKMKPACGRKVTSGEGSGRWLVGDHGALTVALKRQKMRGRMKCGMARGERPGYI